MNYTCPFCELEVDGWQPVMPESPTVAELNQRMLERTLAYEKREVEMLAKIRQAKERWDSLVGLLNECYETTPPDSISAFLGLIVMPRIKELASPD